MVKKNGKHRLVGFVDLGAIHDDMNILSGTLMYTEKIMILSYYCVPFYYYFYYY